MNVKSPVCRIGGKAMLTGWLLRHVPSHTVYCEPFAGGASLLFAKPESKVEILNDIDNCLISLYRCIQNADKRAKLVQLLNETPYSRSVFDTWKYNKDVPAGDIEKAARYFFLSKASFAGDIVSGGFACPSVTGRNPAQTFRNAVDSLEYVASRLKSITLECLPYAEVIRRYDSPGPMWMQNIITATASLKTTITSWQNCFTVSGARSCYRIMPIAFTIGCTTILTVMSMSLSRDRISQPVKQSLLAWNACLPISNLLRQGGCLVECDWHDFLLWCITFFAVRATCWMLGG